MQIVASSSIMPPETQWPIAKGLRLFFRRSPGKQIMFQVINCLLLKQFLLVKQHSKHHQLPPKDDKK